MKYYLICEHCDHNNEVMSEYLTFCESCTKKLALNYHDWQKKHRDATLLDYMEKVCVSEVKIEQVNLAVTASAKDSWSHWIGFSKTLSVMIGAALLLLPIFLGITNLNYTLEATTYARHTLDYTWHEKTYGMLGFRINSPIPLEASELPLPDEVKAVIELAEFYMGGSSENQLKIMLNSFKYLPVVGSINVKAVADGSVNSMKTASGVSNFDFVEVYLRIVGKEAIRQDGSFIQSGGKVHFVNITIADGPVFWLITIIYNKEVSGLEDVVEKVISSVDIQYNSSI